MSKTCRVAVYGTLKSCHNNHNLMGPQAKVLQSDLLLPGLTLYNLGRYPGVLRNPEGSGVYVEVVEVPIGILEYLDAYEGYDVETPETSLFVRESVVLPDGERAFLYLYNDEVGDTSIIIPDGKWVDE